jgi:N-acetylglucosaminyldiphosphoundecaprenol N-acetyl-beta-D-mannosaminyltransferase
MTDRHPTHWETPWRRTFINAVRIDALTEQKCIDAILNALEFGRGGFVATHNLDHLRRLDHDSDFAAICAGAELRVADGMPLVWLSRMLDIGLPERVAGSSLIYTLSTAAAQHGRSIYLLGGDEGTAEGAADVLRKFNPELKIAGTYCVPFGFEKDPLELEQIVTRLREAAPDIVFVALGSPKQEILIVQLRRYFPRIWWLGVGISFSYVCGQVKSPPRWMQRAGCEWLFRLVQEPRRLAKRYLIDGIPFAGRLAARCSTERLRGVRRRIINPTPPAAAKTSVAAGSGTATTLGDM